MRLPSSSKFVIIGAGIHGLSTAWHLATELEARGLGTGADVVVIDKSGVGAGASGIACGVIRNNYFQPAMRELMAHSVSVWESDPEAFSYHGVGYLQISHDGMRSDVAAIHEQQAAIGYPSTFIEGADASAAYMTGIFHDWRAQGITSVLHEHKGGFSNNMAAMEGLAAKAAAEGVRIVAPATVTELRIDANAVTAVETDQGTIACEHLLVAAGPWVPLFWMMLDLPTETDVNVDGRIHTRPTFHYWALQEGTLVVDPGYLRDNDGNVPPVIHVDTDAPLYDDDGALISDEPWGLYYKPDDNFGGVQGGFMPQRVDKPFDEVAVDPYGPASPDFAVDDNFRHTWAAALSHCQKRFEGLSPKMSPAPSGGIGAFTPDSFPVFDRFRDNAYVIADSNHGYKMIGVGALVAKELVGERQSLLEPFRYSRYAEGRLHPVSSSPFPWS
jgi:glycine/D-amino acid oxidase-like deaminating enzyme